MRYKKSDGNGSSAIAAARMIPLHLTFAALFAALTAIGAYIKIPLPFVPFTLQFFFCAMSGILLGSRLGMISQAVYVAIGLAGLPVFAGGGGIAYVLRPSFGYLVGFIFCAFITGKLTEKIRDGSAFVFWKLYVITLAGLFTVYIFGVPYLFFIYNLYLNESKTVWWALYWGFLTTAGGDLLLSFAVAFISKRLIPVSKRYLRKIVL